MAVTKAKAMTKSAIFQNLAEKSSLTRKQVAGVFDALTDLIAHQIGKKGPGVFTIPGGLIKIQRKHRAATKPRQGRNPQTGEAMMIPAKPAKTVVRARALKSLQSML
jgi:nucleoid DNA-binding protein